MGITELRQTRNYATYLRSLGWIVAEANGIYVFIKRLPLLGSIMKIRRGDRILVVKSIIQLAKKQRCRIVYVEPKDDKQYKYYLENGFKISNDISLPSKTIRIDLTKSDKNLLLEMHHKTRYNIGLAKRRGVKIVKSVDFSEFAEFWQKSAKKRGMFLSQVHEIREIYKAFSKHAAILNAEYEGETVSAVMLLSTDKLLYYMYAASTAKGNREYAPSLLVWEALMFGKSMRLKYFDFEGIYDERFPLPAWKGFTRFKKSFGGEVLSYPGQLKKLLLSFRV